MARLLYESRENLKTHVLIPKLWKRFWKTVEDYKDERSFLYILNTHFGTKCQVNINSHRKIYVMK